MTIPVVYATDRASVTLRGGGQVQVHKGTHWAETDPVVKEYPGLFSSDPRYGMQYTIEPEGYDAPPVEQATAAPGEKRNNRR